MKYAVDEIIDDIAIIENVDTKEKEEVSLKLLPQNIKEGNIIIKKDIYYLDKESEVSRRKIIQEKLAKLMRDRNE